MAYEILTGISQDADERARFRARRKYQMDIAHGQIVSFEAGELKGRTEGRLEGRTEVARNLLANRVPLEIITKSTGLSLNEIRALES
jgi:predicted transposase/invertase (TIGR01784 family)